MRLSRPHERRRFVATRQRAFVETFESLRMLYGCTIVSTRLSAIISTIESSEDALSMEEVVKLFSTAFGQVCALKEVDKLVFERFRMIFEVAEDHGPFLAHYEKWQRAEEQVEELAAVAELQAAKGAKKA